MASGESCMSAPAASARTVATPLIQSRVSRPPTSYTPLGKAAQNGKEPVDKAKPQVATSRADTSRASGRKPIEPRLEASIALTGECSCATCFAAISPYIRKNHESFGVMPYSGSQ